MIVLIGEKFPNKVRGILKNWFVEIKKDVFISTINYQLSERILKFVSEKFNENLKFVLIQASNKSKNLIDFYLKN